MKLSFYRSVPSLRSGRVVKKSNTILITSKVTNQLFNNNRNRSGKNTSTRPAGRNATGHITVRHQGGGHKQAFRQID